jgi:hypothetical protein
MCVMMLLMTQPRCNPLTLRTLARTRLVSCAVLHSARLSSPLQVSSSSHPTTLILSSPPCSYCRARILRIDDARSRVLCRYLRFDPLLSIPEPVQVGPSGEWYASSFLTLSVSSNERSKLIDASPCLSSTVGLVSRFGQFYSAVDPGLVSVNVCTESIKIVDVRIRYASSLPVLFL